MNEVAEQQEEFDYDSIVLRRADPDDFDEILNLVEMGEDDIYNRVYSLPNVLKLIETAYLAITVIDRDGKVVAFAAFEDHPKVSVNSAGLCMPGRPATGSLATYQARHGVQARASCRGWI